MAEAGVPVTPGYLGEDQSGRRLAQEAADIGWPVLIKAVAGGGGKGMRKVEDSASFGDALASAKREALAAFGDDRVLLEKYVSRPRHIEVQIFADAHSNFVHMFERDCSIQRRHQKVIEEAPAPGMDAPTREVLCAAAVRAAKAVDYRGAGTVEFIADASEGLRADRIWFMEMNTRLQVEHPVTEAITGLDLVEWQFEVASGRPLPLAQAQIEMKGHAVEARLYAEDPAKGFLPSIGKLSTFDLPAGLRVDTSVGRGDTVSPYYDPMLAKLVCHDETREAAAERLSKACADVRAWPVRTNAWLLSRCLSHADFLRGDVETGFIEARAGALTAPPVADRDILIAAAAAFALDRQPSAMTDPWAVGLGAFRLGQAAGSSLRLYLDGAAVDLTLAGLGWDAQGGELTGSLEDRQFIASRSADGEFRVDGRRVTVADAANGDKVAFEGGAGFAFSLVGEGRVGEAAASDGAVRTPMPGKIVSLAAEVGATVRQDQPLVTLEAMKMEHALKAPFDGVVVEIAVKEGDQVAEGTVVLRVQPVS
jgi:propionyl-CoA carboxylase alpha chain/3-methylcrotonyl-CoA carboxylase alpha subunit